MNYPTLKGMASCFTEPIVRAALNPSRRHDGNASASTLSLADAREYTGVSKEGSGRPNPTLANKKRVDEKYKRVGFHPHRKQWGLPADLVKQVIQKAKVEDEEKMRSLQRLRRFVPDNITH